MDYRKWFSQSRTWSPSSLEEGLRHLADALGSFIERRLESEPEDVWHAAIMEKYSAVENRIARDPYEFDERRDFRWDPATVVLGLGLYWESIFTEGSRHDTLLASLLNGYLLYHGEEPPSDADADALSTLEDIERILRRASKVRDSIEARADAVLALIKELKQKIDSERSPTSLKGMIIGGFKAYAEDQYVPLKPITLIYGPNSAGKSSILHALALANHISTTGEVDVYCPRVGGDSIDLGGFEKYARTPVQEGLLSLSDLIGENLPDDMYLGDGHEFRTTQVDIGFVIDTSLLPESWAPLKHSCKELLIRAKLRNHADASYSYSWSGYRVNPFVAGLSVHLDSDYLLSMHTKGRDAELSFFNAHHPGLADFIDSANGWPTAGHPDNPETSALIKSAQQDLEDSIEGDDELWRKSLKEEEKRGLDKEFQDIATNHPEHDFMQSFGWATW